MSLDPDTTTRQPVLQLLEHLKVSDWVFKLGYRVRTSGWVRVRVSVRVRVRVRVRVKVNKHLFGIDEGAVDETQTIESRQAAEFSHGHFTAKLDVVLEGG